MSQISNHFYARELASYSTY